MVNNNVPFPEQAECCNPIIKSTESKEVSFLTPGGNSLKAVSPGGDSLKAVSPGKAGVGPSGVLVMV